MTETTAHQEAGESPQEDPCYNVYKSLMELVAKLAAGDDDQKTNKMKEEISNIADEYCALEEDTKRAVYKVKAYGENLKEAAEDYLKDDILENFTKSVMNMDDAKKKLEDVYKKQAKIYVKVDRVTLEAREMFKEELVKIPEAIALQMVSVSEELVKIPTSLRQIEEHLSRSQDAEKEVIAAQSPVKKSKLKKRVIDKAGDLIKACDDYFTVVKDMNSKVSRDPIISVKMTDTTARGSLQEDTCEVCLKIDQSVCSACFIGNSADQMTESIKNILFHGCNVSKYLMELVAKLTPVDDDQKINKMKEEISNIAFEYCALEYDTKRAVTKVKIYGEHLKEAAKDYLDDDILEDFTKKVMNINDAKKKLEDANKKHAEINLKIDRVALEAQEMFESHQDGQPILQQCKEIVEEIVGRAAATGSAGTTGITMLANLAGNDKLVQFALGMAVSVTYGGFLFLSSKKRKELIKGTYENIALKMASVSEQLEKISKSLEKIEYQLSLSQDAEKEVIAAQNHAKKSKLMKRVINKAGNLIKACDVYFTEVNDMNSKVTDIRHGSCGHGSYGEFLGEWNSACSAESGFNHCECERGGTKRRRVSCGRGLVAHPQAGSSGRRSGGG